MVDGKTIEWKKGDFMTIPAGNYDLFTTEGGG